MLEVPVLSIIIYGSLVQFASVAIITVIILIVRTE